MRIEVVDRGQTFEGTPRQILMQMKSLSRGAEHLSLREFIAANVARGGMDAQPVGESDEELAESFVAQMLEGGYARRA